MTSWGGSRELDCVPSTSTPPRTHPAAPPRPAPKEEQAANAWPPERQAEERLRIYRLTIRADVASLFGREQIMEEISQLFESNDSPSHWDVFEVECSLRETP
jgi:hypothetical protein